MSKLINSYYTTKSTPLKVKDIDVKGRTVVVYASEYNSIDSDRDRVLPGAFSKSVAENGPLGTKRIKQLWQHDYREVIGKPTEMKDDEVGLLCTSTIVKTQKGNDAMELYEHNLLEHSVGFRLVKGEWSKLEDAYLIKEAQLFEFSSVTWGANKNTPLIEIKSLTVEEKKTAIEKLNTRMANLITAIRKGKFTDETFELLDIELLQIQTSYNSLLELEPVTTTQKESEPDTLVMDTLKSLFSN